MIPEQRKSIWKWAYAWIGIMLAVNLFYVGYAITDNPDYGGMTESSLYNIFYSSQGTTNTNIASLTETTSGYSEQDMTENNEGLIGYILDKLDSIANYMKFIGFAVGLFAFGGLFLTWDILTGTVITNQFIKLIILVFMGVGNIIFIVLITRFILNRFKED